jgi:hypothetical protein
VSVVCCQVEVSATGWSLVQRSPTECGVSEVCDRETSFRIRLSSHKKKSYTTLDSVANDPNGQYDVGTPI